MLIPHMLVHPRSQALGTLAGPVKFDIERLAQVLAVKACIRSFPGLARNIWKEKD